MKRLKAYLGYVTLMAVLFISCSKDENENASSTSKASLSFEVVLQDLADSARNKQSNIGDMPVCLDDEPAYVEIILMQGETPVVGSVGDPFKINIVAGQLFTQSVPELELETGTYSLSYFAVYNNLGDLMWIAPSGGVLGNFVAKLLPYEISLGEGVKKYVPVSVLCFDDRMVHQYGDVVFDDDDMEKIRTFEYCFFANYCNEDGRHYPARYSVDITIDGEPVVTDATNITGTNQDGDLFAEPLCLPLPDLPQYDDDDDYLEYTITLLDWEGVYEADEADISGSLSRNDVRANFDGDSNIDYQHVRFGCGNGNGGLPEGLPDFNVAIFSDPTNISNPFYGPPADAIYEYEVYEVEDGVKDSEPSETLLIERRSETREVMGIATVIQHDVVYVEGVVVEDTDDWLAQDDSGNLWYMGELSKNYDELGNFLGTEGSWEAGVDGALPGYWIPGDPSVGQFYYQEFYKGKAEDYAEVVALGETVEVNGIIYEEVMITKDINPLEPEVYELKYYASGTGLIKEEAYEDGQLTEIVTLAGIIMESPIPVNP